MRRAWPGVLLLPLACGPEGFEPAALDAIRHEPAGAVGNDAPGRLVLLDPDARTTTRIDDRVFAGVGAQPSRVHDGAILYSVDDGERSGVWIAGPGA